MDGEPAFDIEVRRSIYEAGRHMEAVATLTKISPAFNLAEMLRDCWKDRNEEQFRFWREVCQHMMTLECSDARAKIIIVPD